MSRTADRGRFMTDSTIAQKINERIEAVKKVVNLIDQAGRGDDLHDLRVLLINTMSLLRGGAGAGCLDRHSAIGAIASPPALRLRPLLRTPLNGSRTDRSGAGDAAQRIGGSLCGTAGALLHESGVGSGRPGGLKAAGSCGLIRSPSSPASSRCNWHRELFRSGLAPRSCRASSR